MTAWIIGGTSGIGAECADIHDIQPSVSKCLRTGPNVSVTSYNTLVTYAGQCGPFDQVVYCAGLPHLDWIRNVDITEIRHVFDVNVIGFINVMKALANTQDGGNVVVITSEAAINPMRCSIGYCASKAALEMAVRVAARELAPSWRINAVAPGFVEDTPISDYIQTAVPKMRQWSRKQADDYQLSRVPAGRHCTKTEVANTVWDTMYGANYMTGSIVRLTGGA